MDLKDTWNIMLLEAQLHDDLEGFDHNTIVLMIMRSNLVSLLSALRTVSKGFTDYSSVEMSGLMMGLLDCVEWIDQNADLTGAKNGEE